MIREVKKFGDGGAHIIIPKEFLGQSIEIPLEIDDSKTFMTKEQIRSLIKEEIDEAKRGY